MRRFTTVLLASCAGLVAVPATAAAFGLTPATGALPDSSSFWAGTCDLHDADATAFGAPGDTPVNPRDCIDGGVFGSHIQTSPPSWRLVPQVDAGGHPDATATFTIIPNPDPASGQPDGLARDAVVQLPAGVIGNVRSVPQCTLTQFAQSPAQCPSASQVGVVTLRAVTDFGPQYLSHPVYNLQARRGVTAELGIPDLGGGATFVNVFAKARTDGDFGVTTGAKSLPTAFPLIQQQLTLWGVPWAQSHDVWRVPQGWFPPAAGFRGIPPTGLDCSNDGQGTPACPTPYEASWGPIRPFFTNPTECSGTSLTTGLALDSYEDPAAFDESGDPVEGDPNWLSFGSSAPPVAECAAPPFEPTLDITPTSSAADSATGLSIDLTIPQNDDPPAPVADDADDVVGAPAHWKTDSGRATAQLDKAVVTLPEGASVNPSAAAGLEACSDAQIGLVEQGNPARFNNADPLDGDASDGFECPEGAKIGTVEVNTPLLAEPVTGEVVLGQPKKTGNPPRLDPESGQMLRLFLVLRNTERALIAKIAGTTVADKDTGQLTATFDKNPRLPFETMHLEFKGGPRGIVALPQRCGSGHGWSAMFTPWTAAHGGGGQSTPDGGAFNLDANCGFGFAPSLQAGMDNSRTRGSGAFTVRFTRSDGQQWLSGLTARLPRGLLASVKGVPLCSSAEASAGGCPAGSRIGSVDAAAGSGTPFLLEKPGDVYLTQGYKGCAYGLMVRVPVEAGPFRGDLALDPIVVRQAVCVDPSDATVTATSDPFPQIWQGIPLRVREVTVKVDRPGFMLNPSGCTARGIGVTLTSAEGAAAPLSSPFQATGCGNLPFKPQLGLTLTGRKQMKTGKHPGVRAVVAQAGVGEAGIQRAEVRLPKSLALDPDNAQALCEFDAGTRPDLENHCPKGSIVGRARAVSPLLDRPLVGNVYFVKNVRRGAGGSVIRTLPMLIVALRGEIAINLRGESSVAGGKLVNTFANVPDAPISAFNLNVNGGRNGILAVTRTRKAKIDICRSRSQIAEVDTDGHNGRRHDFDVKLKTACPTKKQQRAAARKKAAAKRKAAQRRQRGSR